MARPLLREAPMTCFVMEVGLICEGRVSAPPMERHLGKAGNREDGR